MCLLDFYTTQILMSTTVLIECISWLIKMTKNDGNLVMKVRQLTYYNL